MNKDYSVECKLKDLMMTSLFTAPTRLPLLAHGAATLAAFGLFQMAKARLDASYAASGHPVDYATGQTTFDAAQIKGYYAAMEAQGTLDVYVRTQIIDFGFILGVALFGWLLGTLLARGDWRGRWGRRLGLGTAACALLGAGMDSAENLISFVMLADPQGFAGWLALPYSGAAVAKFICLTSAMACALLALGVIAAQALLRRPLQS